MHPSCYFIETINNFFILTVSIFQGNKLALHLKFQTFIFCFKTGAETLVTNHDRCYIVFWHFAAWQKYEDLVQSINYNENYYKFLKKLHCFFTTCSKTEQQTSIFMLSVNETKPKKLLKYTPKITISLALKISAVNGNLSNHNEIMTGKLQTVYSLWISFN